jgi:hypothetical protein
VNPPWLLAATENGNWHFGIGDPTPIGWFTAFAYLAATAACLMVFILDRRVANLGQPASPRFWLILAVLLLLLGINKQLDLQTLLNDVGRRIAKTQGWYQRRRIYQVIFIALVAGLGALAIGYFSWLARKQWKRNFVALLGTAFLYVFVLTRASSIHHVDAALQWELRGWKWNWILELGGIAIVLAGCLLALKSQGATEVRGLATGSEADNSLGPRRYAITRGIDARRSGSRPPPK